MIAAPFFTKEQTAENVLRYTLMQNGYDVSAGSFMDGLIGTLNGRGLSAYTTSELTDELARRGGVSS